jgi:membrane-bound lytic murein transglycosylase F
LAWSDNLRAAFPISEEVEYGWAVHPQHAELLAAIDAFFKREYRGLFYNVTRRKYFEDTRKVRSHVEYRASRAGQISPWDANIQQLAGRYGFDWRLLVAQMYQESRFDPRARSFAGARGLLQVMPRTAREMGFKNLDDPVTGLEAGVRYLDWTRDRFGPSLSTDDRIWFALAAYNVGPGHVNDARRIARDRGWDADRWFDNVERAMLLKEKPEVHRQTRFGYARGREPVAYVRDIRDRYSAYLEAPGSLPQPVPTAQAQPDHE